MTCHLTGQHTAMPPRQKLSGIRLIATDLDGTLFKRSLDLPESLPDIISALRKKGIYFATASGRNWPSQKTYFPNQLDQIFFICDNGAFLIEKQQPVFISELAPSFWKDVVKKCTAYGENCRAILCGTKGTYVQTYTGNPDMKKLIEHFYFGLTTVPDLQKVEDRIFKISICNLSGTGGTFYQDFFRTYSGRSNVLRTAEQFMDIMNKGISKGTGLRFLQEQLHISPSETVVFGDFENDINLFEQAEHTFIMENAPLYMRKHARYLAPSNEEEGVVKIIRQFIL